MVAVIFAVVLPSGLVLTVPVQFHVPLTCFATSPISFGGSGIFMPPPASFGIAGAPAFGSALGIVGFVGSPAFATPTSAAIAIAIIESFFIALSPVKSGRTILGKPAVTRRVP